nr:T9SS type A sorting domain-containing protein [Lacinutrix sp. C3R15]
MYPNPASSSQVTVNLNTPAATISLYTVRGQFLLKKPLEQGNNTLDISRLSTGLYIAAIKTEDTTVTKKLIIQ